MVCHNVDLIMNFYQLRCPLPIISSGMGLLLKKDSSYVTLCISSGANEFSALTLPFFAPWWIRWLAHSSSRRTEPFCNQ